MKTGITVVLMAVLAAAGLANAGVMYVDAAAANTTLADGTACTPVDPYNNTDNQWGLRTLGNSKTVYTANDSNTNPGEDAPMIRTTISGLIAGDSYDVFVYYWVGGNGAPTGNQQWDIAAGLTLATVTSYAWNGGTQITDASIFDSTVLIAESDRRLFAIDLGSVAADTAGQIQVFVDDVPGNINRTWYDGVGAFAVPEPATLAFFGLGSLIFIRRQRK